MERVLKDFLISNSINYNYFLSESIFLNTSLCFRGPNVFCVFCFVFKRFYLTFKVVHVHESISYVIWHLFGCICCLHVYCACVFVYMILCIYVYICVFRLHNKDE